jgi:hypothetical protein
VQADQSAENAQPDREDENDRLDGTGWSLARESVALLGKIGEDMARCSFERGEACQHGDGR